MRAREATAQNPNGLAAEFTGCTAEPLYSAAEFSFSAAKYFYSAANFAGLATESAEAATEPTGSVAKFAGLTTIFTEPAQVRRAFRGKITHKISDHKKNRVFCSANHGEDAANGRFPGTGTQKTAPATTGRRSAYGENPYILSRCSKLFLCSKIYKNHSEHLLIRGGNGAACRTFYGRHHRGGINRR